MYLAGKVVDWSQELRRTRSSTPCAINEGVGKAVVAFVTLTNSMDGWQGETFLLHVDERWR
jgi:hypothetical protein